MANHSVEEAAKYLMEKYEILSAERERLKNLHLVQIEELNNVKKELNTIVLPEKEIEKNE